jgi:Cu(I)/Ag(I) efflux system membrane fusion protein
MNTLHKYKIQLAIGSICLLVGAGFGTWLAKLSTMTPPVAQGIVPLATQPTQKVLYWYDPMMPQQHFDHAGKSPYMDMELVPKYAEQQLASGVKIDPLLAENIGMRFTTVQRLPLSQQIIASGVVAFNERDLNIVQARSSGFVQKVWPIAVGDIVKAGQPLVQILQPEWVAAQQELLLVHNWADPSLLKAAQERLRLLGMPKATVQRLLSSGEVQATSVVTAPTSGVIQNVEVRNGMSIANGQTLVSINGFSTVWLDAAVPEAQAGQLKAGDSAEVRLNAFPEHVWHGKVSSLLPMLNEASRSVRVRVELANAQQLLRPGQTAQVKFNTQATLSVLAVTTEALIRTGKHTVVMLRGEAGRYIPQEVSIGTEIGDKTVVTAGLTEGQQIIASGQFLIDSEASLNGIEAQRLPVATQTELGGAP